MKKQVMWRAATLKMAMICILMTCPTATKAGISINRDNNAFKYIDTSKQIYRYQQDECLATLPELLLLKCS